MIIAGLVFYFVAVSVFVLSSALAAKQQVPRMEIEQAQIVPLPMAGPGPDLCAPPLERAA